MEVRRLHFRKGPFCKLSSWAGKSPKLRFADFAIPFFVSDRRGIRRTSARANSRIQNGQVMTRRVKLGWQKQEAQ